MSDERLGPRVVLSKEALRRADYLHIGSEGCIGAAIRRELAGLSVYAPPMAVLDITRSRLVDEAISSFWGESVIVSAGFTNVGGIEENEALYQMAIDINFRAMQFLAETCFREGKRMVYVGGSGYERAGSLDNPGPHLESDPFADEIGEIGLLGRYAETKRFGSKAVMDAFKDDPSRLAVLYFDYPCGVVEGVGIDYQRPYYLQTLLINYKRGIPPFKNQLLTITLVEDIARVVRIIEREKLSGVFNVAVKGRVNPHYLTRRMVRRLEGGKVAQQIKSGSIIEYRASRERQGKKCVYPISGGLDSSYTEERLAAVEPGFAFLDVNGAVDHLMEGPGGLREFWKGLKASQAVVS